MAGCGSLARGCPFPVSFYFPFHDFYMDNTFLFYFCLHGYYVFPILFSSYPRSVFSYLLPKLEVIHSFPFSVYTACYLEACLYVDVVRV